MNDFPGTLPDSFIYQPSGDSVLVLSKGRFIPRDKCYASEAWSGHKAEAVRGSGHPGILAVRVDVRVTIRMQQPNASASRGNAGFTLLEILVVVAILGLLVLQVGPAVLRQFGGARVSVAKQSVEQLAGVLDLYKFGVGSYPTTEQGLVALNTPPGGVTGWEGPYLKGYAQPLDPWNHPYLYRNASARPGHEFDLCSRGPNNQAGEAGPGRT